MEDDMKNQPAAYWKERLTPAQYHVLREKGTERPFTGAFYLHHDTGMYVCAACGAELFSSETKFDSDCGWPSFDRALEGNVAFHEDNSFGMHRIEVTCARCGGHLGHVFDDGPRETTGTRFCINSLALDFKPKE
jgi:peptide-methionine (R)-S-oxide reductase